MRIKRILLSNVLDISRGYARLFRASGALVTAAAVIVLLSLVIVTPLWFLATRFTAVYTSLCLIGAGAVVVGYTIRRLATDPSLRKRAVRRIVKGAGALVALALVYGTILLYSYGFYAAAIPISVVLAAVIGILLHGKKNSN